MSYFRLLCYRKASFYKSHHFIWIRALTSSALLSAASHLSAATNICLFMKLILQFYKVTYNNDNIND